MFKATIFLLFVQSSAVGDFTFTEKRWAAAVDEGEEVQVAATLQSGSARLVVGCDHHVSTSLTVMLHTDLQLVANRPPLAGIQRFGEPPKSISQIGFTYQVNQRSLEAKTGTLSGATVEFKDPWGLAASLAKGDRITFRLPTQPQQAGTPPLDSEIAFSSRGSRLAMERVAKRCNDRLLQGALARN